MRTVLLWKAQPLTEREEAALAQETATKSLQSPRGHLRSGKTGLLLLSLDVVSDHLTVAHGQEDVIVSGAVAVAGAHLDEHHLPLEEVPSGQQNSTAMVLVRNRVQQLPSEQLLQNWGW